MPFVIKIASNTAELDGVISIRKACLQSMSGTTQANLSLLDQYDLYPDTLQLLIQHESRIVGNFRCVEFNLEQAPLKELYDFSESYKNIQANAACLDLFVLDENLPRFEWIWQQALSTALQLLFRRHHQFAFAVIPEVCLSGLNKETLRIVDEAIQFRGSKWLPVIFDLVLFQKEFVQRINDREILRFQEVFYTILFEPGEILVVEGERGATSYLILEGEVQVVAAKNDPVLRLKTIGAGNMIGEIAMVTNEARTASILATKPTACIAMDRPDFMKSVAAQPNKSVDMFKIFAKRIQEINQRLIRGNETKENNESK